jgi:hypothetical protein
MFDGFILSKRLISWLNFRKVWGKLLQDKQLNWRYGKKMFVFSQLNWSASHVIQSNSKAMT